MIHSLAEDFIRMALSSTGRSVTRIIRHQSLHLLVAAAAPVREKSSRPGGVLFLDELAEWHRTHLDPRQTIETGKAVVSRANHHITYPAFDFSWWRR